MTGSPQKPKKLKDVQGEFEQVLKANTQAFYVLKLFITGMSKRSVAAQENLREICELYLRDRYSLEVIDILQEPQRAREANLVASPALIKEFPLPMRKLLGDLSITEKVLIGLDLVKKV